MKIVHTIEIEPLDYTENEYSYPNSTKTEDPEAWSNYWYTCISDSNLQNLKPVELGSNLVDINKIGDSELKIILQKELKDIDLSDIEKYVEKLIGGIVIIEHDKVIIEPSCCGDLSDIQNWENIQKSKLDQWNQLWIGHPWLFYKRSDNCIILSDYTDYNLKDFKDISEKYKFPEQEFTTAIKSSREHLNNFKNRITKILEKLEIDNSHKIAKLMTGSK